PSDQVDADTIAGVARTPGVVSVSAISRGPVRPYLSDHPGETVELEAIDPATYFDRGGFAWTHGDNKSAQASLARGGAVLLPEPLAHRIGTKVGSTIRLAIADGPKPFVVAGRFVSFINQADIVVSAADGRIFGTPPPHELNVYTSPGRPAAVQ